MFPRLAVEAEQAADDQTLFAVAWNDERAGIATLLGFQAVSPRRYHVSSYRFAGR